MFKLTATLETETKTETREHTGTAKEIEALKAEMRATEPKGSTATYSVEKI